MKSPLNLLRNWSAKKIAAVAIIIALALGNLAAWWWVAQARTDLQKAVQADDATPSVITVPVEKRAISRTVTADCTTQQEFTNSPTLTSTSGEDSEAVVTALPKKKGDTVDSGEVMTEISSRPVFAAQGDIRSFRTLKVGMRGADVEQLHSFLRGQGLYTGEIKSPYSVTTGDAVARLYTQSGYDPSVADPEAAKALKTADRTIKRARSGQDVEGQEIPSQDEYDDLRRAASPQVPLGELVFLARTPATLSTMNLQIGQVPQDGQLVATSGKEVLSCTVQAGDVPSLSTGQNVLLDAAPTEADLEVKTIRTEGGSGSTGAGASGTDGNGAYPQDPAGGTGNGAAPAAPEDNGGETAPSASVIVSVPKDFAPYQGPARIETERGPDDTLAVPSTAVRTDESGAAYVLVHRDGTDPERVNVTVEFEADGSAAVSSPELSESDLVEITQ